MIDMVLAQANGNPASQPSLLVNLVPFLLIFVIFYFLLIRPQVQRQRKQDRMVKALSKGDRVVTQGGLFGTIVGTKDSTVVLRIADNVKVEVVRTSITSVVGKSDGG